jgi:hypothetical protein
MELRHLILSHHGVPELRFPRDPKTLEALIVHYMDDLDAQGKRLPGDYPGGPRRRVGLDRLPPDSSIVQSTKDVGARAGIRGDPASPAELPGQTAGTSWG